MIKLTILSDEAHEIAEALQQKIADSDALRGTNRESLLTIDQVTCHPDQVDTDNVTVLLSDPDLTAVIINKCSALKWCQSTWAGNAPLLNAGRTDYMLTGLKGIFGKLMREYVFAYLLQHARNLNAFEKNQRAATPKWEASPRVPLNGQTLGVVGLGNIGQALIPVANAFGMKVVGLTRSGNDVKGAERVYTPSEIKAFSGACDHIVNLMPDTPTTQNLLSYEFFNALKPYSIFINAGRGSAVDDEALISALDKGTLAHAVLDVFRHEPLPPTHRFWHHPNITITAHTAAESQPSDVASVFFENAERYLARLPLKYQFDFAKGY